MPLRGAAALAALTLGLDQLSKWWIIGGLKLPAVGTVPVLPFLSFTWVENRGVSMGLFAMDGAAGRWLLVAIAAAIAVVVSVWIGRTRDPVERTALALVLGGAIGNIVDRVRFGYVADFLHLHVGSWSFYVFNVADAAITVGVALLLLRTLTRRHKPEGREE